MKTKDFSGIKNNGRLPDPNQIQVPGDIGDLLDDYVESANSMLDELEKVALAYETDDNRHENAAAIRRILHKLKGESQMVGIDEVRELCHQAEDAFEGLAENRRPDMLLRVKDWVCAAVYYMAESEKT